MSTKATPKSCSCPGCKASRSSDSVGVKHRMKTEERAFRHASKHQLKRFGEDADILPAGTRSRLG